MRFLGDQAAGLRSLLGRGGLRIALFVSGIRRAGQTTTVANLALAGARLGKNVMVIDEARSACSVAALLGVNGRYDLGDVISGRRNLDEVIVHGPDGLIILPVGRALHGIGANHPALPSQLTKAFEHLSDELDWLLIDAASGFDTRLLPLSLSANEVVVLMPGVDQGLTASYRVIKLLQREFGMNRFRILATRTHDEARSQLAFQRVRAVARQHLHARVDWIGSVPYDTVVKRASAMARPLITAFPNSPSAQAIRSSAEYLLGIPAEHEDVDPVGVLLKRLVEGSRLDFAAAALA